MKPTPDNTGKVMTRYTRAAGSSTMSLNLNPFEALQLKAFIATLRLRGNKIPSMSLIARRAVLAYLTHIQFSPETRASEMEVLEKMATRYTDRKNVRAE
jgi:hypothetical protein